ncbi:ATP-binding protein [Massilia sp. R2A-15]|uniref:ATP-binding protein n=1 Tax=Massilia sp. R2A-15 TaxID=3064278 RepID=UPI0027373D70|nr:ATP-binding protein [Massilia sp. R2A-15]WLI91573.1 ATP-binding protein [Massilia sp. R2A-15]
MRVLLLLFLVALQSLVWPALAHAGAGQVVLAHAGRVAMTDAALFKDRGGEFPASAAAVPAWRATLEPVAKVDPAGGAYWMVIPLRNESPSTQWVMSPHNTMIYVAESRLLGADGSIQHLRTGFKVHHDYLLHYGNDVTLAPQGDYQLVIRFSSPYFVRAPVMVMQPRDEFQQLVARENFIIIASLGALAALAIFNFFIYSFTRNPSYLYYALYVVSFGLAWATAFNVLADLIDFRDARFHYVPFFLLPVFSTLFYLPFLRLKEIAPRLAAISKINLVLPLLLLPTCLFAIGWAHKLATIMLSFWMVLALICGIVAWRRGFHPARYFVYGFIAVLAPALLIVPANLGLISAAGNNTPLLSLVGGTVDALLLAFALADQIRILRDKMEQSVATRTQELLRANAELTVAKEHAEVVSRHRIDFLSAMSHDIRTPLAGVIGMLKLGLRDSAVQGRTGEYLRIGLHNSESLLAILNDILDFSKIDAGKLTLESTSFRLAGLIADATGILQGQADEKGLALRVNLADGLPEFVEGDPTRIRQILVNLLGNAIKFTERGEVRLTVAAGPPVGSLTPVSFAVRDTGPGIDPDVQARLFQKFEQADHSTTRRYGGTGLGLAICKELVELMHGSISVDSQPGAGSRFAFTLPLAAAAAPPETPQDPRRERHAYRLNILCAEDMRTNQIIIGALLETMGHRVHIVENGVEALRALASADYDMVLMDIRMPVMDGEQATRTIRVPRPGALKVRDPGIPIIALTANASAPDNARYIAAGMDGFLSKPVDDARLHEAIQQTIDKLLAAGRELPRTEPAAPAAPAAPDTPPADPLHIVPLPGLSAAHMVSIARAFLAEAPRRVDQARAAIARGDQGAAADAFHAVKGSAGYLSSPRLQELASALEARARAGQLAMACPQFAEFEQALAHALASLRAASEAGAIL